MNINQYDVSISLKFDNSKISEIKFEFVKDNQKNFGIIEYSVIMK